MLEIKEKEEGTRVCFSRPGKEPIQLYYKGSTNFRISWGKGQGVGDWWAGETLPEPYLWIEDIFK